jgi:hypothetical protein
MGQTYLRHTIRPARTHLEDCTGGQDHLYVSPRLRKITRPTAHNITSHVSSNLHKTFPTLLLLPVSQGYRKDLVQMVHSPQCHLLGLHLDLFRVSNRVFNTETQREF